MLIDINDIPNKTTDELRQLKQEVTKKIQLLKGDYFLAFGYIKIRNAITVELSYRDWLESKLQS